jgi:hypothetical protein
MSALRPKRKSRTTAPATVLFSKTKNDQGKYQLCVYAQCTYGGRTAGPVWGHTRASVGRCLAALTTRCDCGRPFHKAREYQGRRVVTAAGD